MDKQKNSIKGYIAIVLAIIPILVYLYTTSKSAGSVNESSGGSIGWLLVTYYFTVGIFIFIGSLILGIKGLKDKNKIPSYISFFIHAFKILYLLIHVIPR